MKVTLEQVMAISPCKPYTPKRLLELSGGRREISAEEILGFNINHADKIWLAVRLIKLDAVKDFAIACADRAKGYAARAEAWAAARAEAWAARAEEAAWAAARAAKSKAAAEVVWAASSAVVAAARAEEAARAAKSKAAAKEEEREAQLKWLRQYL